MCLRAHRFATTICPRLSASMFASTKGLRLCTMHYTNNFHWLFICICLSPLILFQQFFPSHSLSSSAVVCGRVPLPGITVHWLLLNGMAWKELNSSMTCKSASPQNLPTILCMWSLSFLVAVYLSLSLAVDCLFFIVVPTSPCHTHELFYNLIKRIIYFCLFKFQFPLSLCDSAVPRVASTEYTSHIFEL